MSTASNGEAQSGMSTASNGEDQSGISTARAKRWCFTLFSYTPEEEAYLKNEEEDENGKLNEIHEEAAYLAFQREICPTTGRPHLQGAVIFHKQLRFNKVKAMLPRAHLEKMHHPPNYSHKYVTKTDTREPGTEPYIWGDIPEDKSGTRTEFEDYKQSIAEGIVDSPTLMDRHSQLYARYPNWCRGYRQNKTKFPDPPPITKYYDWQKDCTDRLLLNDPMDKPYDREILFIVDKTGKGGKSTYVRDFAHTHKKKVIGKWPDTGKDKEAVIQIMEPGKKADLARVINPTTNILFVDVTRQNLDTLQYASLESFKNQLVFDSKYGSNMKKLQPMHITFLMNEHPNYQALSADRYVVWELNSDGSYLEMSKADIYRSCEEARQDHEEEKELKRLDRKRKLQELRNKVES